MSDPGAVFDALGDPRRRQLMVELSTLGTATPSELARHVPITRQAVSKHLDMLEIAGLVSFERRGRAVLYHLTPEPLADAVTWMTQVGAQWDERLDALKSQLQRRKR